MNRKMDGPTGAAIAAEAQNNGSIPSECPIFPEFGLYGANTWHEA